MRQQVAPEPAPEESEALRRALAHVRPERPAAYTSLWRAAGLAAYDEDQATARRRNSDGATRA